MRRDCATKQKHATLRLTVKSNDVYTIGRRVSSYSETEITRTPLKEEMEPLIDTGLFMGERKKEKK